MPQSVRDHSDSMAFYGTAQIGLISIHDHSLGIYAQHVQRDPFTGPGVLVKRLWHHILDPDLFPIIKYRGNVVGSDPGGVEHYQSFP
jgi:hypothetical protein